MTSTPTDDRNWAQSRRRWCWYRIGGSHQTLLPKLRHS
jgi:hypothetical protein